jgi:hypothetical protein
MPSEFLGGGDRALVEHCRAGAELTAALQRGAYIGSGFKTSKREKR